MLPEFAMRVDRDMLERMSDSFQAAKKRVPTRYLKYHNRHQPLQ